MKAEKPSLPTSAATEMAEKLLQRDNNRFNMKESYVARLAHLRDDILAFGEGKLKLEAQQTDDTLSEDAQSENALRIAALKEQASAQQMRAIKAGETLSELRTQIELRKEEIKRNWRGDKLGYGEIYPRLEECDRFVTLIDSAEKRK